MTERRILCSNLSLGSGLSQIARLAALLPAFIVLSGCQLTNAASPVSVSTPITSNTAVTVVLSGAADTRLDASTQFTAQVSNTSNTAVTWQVDGVTGGSSHSGTISTAGLYTAPAQLPNPSQVTITAVSQASAAATGQITESIWNPVPKITSVSATQSSPQSALALDVKGSAFISGAQLQVAGNTVPTTFVSSTELQATLPTPAAAITSLAVNVVNPNPGSISSAIMNAQIKVVAIAVSGAPNTRLGASTQFTAQVSNLSNTAVTWQVDGIPGGSSSSGTISSTGLYTAPALLPSPATVTITAVSQASSSSSGQITEDLWNPTPTISTVTATQTSPDSILTIDVKGSGFADGAQLQVGGISIPTTVLSTTELLATLPTPAAGTTSVAVNALNPNPGSAASAVATAQIQVVKVPISAAARLLDQATFGPTLADMQHVQSIGLNAYIAEQMATPATLLPDVANPAPAQCLKNAAYCAQSEWWQLALTANDQLRQRVAFALSEMFVVSANSINGYAITPFHNILAQDAFANFSTLMKDVTLSPAMGAYLNMLNSYKPGNGQIANENYAREMMQLFTTGTDQLNPDGSLVLDSSGNPIPVYTQAQVQAFARAYTGWTYATAPGTQHRPGSPTTHRTVDDPMAAVESAHDMASKILLNGTTLPSGQTAETDLERRSRQHLRPSERRPFVCRQLIQHLVASNPTPAYVARISAVFADNGSGVRGDLAAVVNAILMDPEARAGDVRPHRRRRSSPRTHPLSHRRHARPRLRQHRPQQLLRLP